MTSDAMIPDTTATPDTGPRSRWDLWLLGAGVVVLLLLWILEPFLMKPPPIPGNMDGAPVARVNPPAGWFKGERGRVFQERIVATPQYEKGGVTFDLPGEKKRLQAWVSKKSNRDDLLRDPLGISAYHALHKDAGGRISQHVKWFPHKVKADLSDSYTQLLFKNHRLQEHVVLVPGPEDPNKRSSGYTSRAVEYVPINMHERGFGLEDLDLTRSRASVAHDGRPIFAYHLKPNLADVYRDFSTKYIGFECATIVHGYVLSLPYFASPITSAGLIAMLTQGEVTAFVEEIRAMLPGR